VSESDHHLFSSTRHMIEKLLIRAGYELRGRDVPHVFDVYAKTDGTLIWAGCSFAEFERFLLLDQYQRRLC
jgi:hypothetical protein